MGVHATIANGLTRASAWLEARPGLVLLVLFAVYVPAVLDLCRATPMGHDELFTYYIAQAPTLGAMWRQTRTLDLNPPLSFVLTRISFRLLGVNALAARLPEMAGFALWMVCTFVFVRRRMGVLFGALAALLLLESDLFQFAVVARPYMLMLGLLALALVAWQAAAEGRRRGLWVAVLLLAGVGMMLSHIFALLGLAALLLGEAWRTYRSRRIDWLVAAALLVPPAVVATYDPMLRNHAGAIYPAAFVPDGQAIFDFYIAAVSRLLIALSLTALLVLVLLGVKALRGTGQEHAPRWFFTQPEWVAAAWLMAAPLVLIVRLMLGQGAFFNRYGALATVGFVVLAVALLGRWTGSQGRPDPRAALLGSLVVLGMSGLLGAVPHELREHDLLPTVTNTEPRVQPCAACARTAAIDPTLPLVDASGLAFLEMNHNESAATLQRVFYLTDAQASMEFAHADIFEQMPRLVAEFHLAGHTAAYPDFVGVHRRFFVLGRYEYPEDWLLRKLQADGAEIRVLGRVSDSYRDTELYEVTVR